MFLARVPLKLLVSLISHLVACSARIVGDRHTGHVTLAVHARRGFMSIIIIVLLWEAGKERAEYSCQG